jgi:hypothetical protein
MLIVGEATLFTIVVPAGVPFIRRKTGLNVEAPRAGGAPCVTACFEANSK